MLEETMQPGDLALGAETTATTSPFDDLATIHELYHQRVFRFLLMNLRDRDAALSLTQDTFTNAWRSRASFRGDCAIATWLMRIALNLLRDHTRTEMFRFWKRAADTAVDAGDMAHQLRHPSVSAEADMVAKEKLAAVWESVERLSPKQRTVFLLRFVEEMELNEIAAATNMPLATVKSHLYRALDHVRTQAGSSQAGIKKGKR